MRYVILISLLISAAPASAQDNGSVQALRDEVTDLRGVRSSLSEQIEILTDSLQYVEQEIAYRERSIRLSLVDSFETVDIEIRMPTDLLDSPSTHGSTMDSLNSGDIVQAFAKESIYWKVRTGDDVGYVSDTYVSASDDDRRTIEAIMERRETRQRKREAKTRAREQQLKEERKQRIARREAQIRQRRGEIEKSPAWVSGFTVNLRKSETVEAEVIRQLERGDKVFVQNDRGEWKEVWFYGSSPHDVVSAEQLESDYVKGWIHEDLLSDTEVESHSRHERRRIAFLRKNPGIAGRYKSAVRNGKIMIGMTDEMARASWGPPDNVNRTVNRYGTREQWIYGDLGYRTYVYFENGDLTSWQD